MGYCIQDRYSLLHPAQTARQTLGIAWDVRLRRARQVVAAGKALAGKVQVDMVEAGKVVDNMGLPRRDIAADMVAAAFPEQAWVAGVVPLLPQEVEVAVRPPQEVVAGVVPLPVRAGEPLLLRFRHRGIVWQKCG